MTDQYTLRWNDFELALGRRTAIMGIVNITPDSFSDGGRFFTADAALDQALRLVAEGADIIDIGGESTRPYAEAVPAEQEINRVVPVIEKLAAKVRIPISIDTTKAAVAKAALAAGASIINDISALRMDPKLAEVAARNDVPVVLMHMQGEPRTMQINPVYQDVVAEVRSFLAEAVSRATKAGIARNKIIVDPGIGFGKTVTHNLLLIQNLAALADLNVPILAGSSRKAFIRKLLATPSGEEPTPDDRAVAFGTQATVAAAVLNGAHIVRVHNVADTRCTVKLIDAIRNAATGSVDGR